MYCTCSIVDLRKVIDIWSMACVSAQFSGLGQHTLNLTLFLSQHVTADDVFLEDTPEDLGRADPRASYFPRRKWSGPTCRDHQGHQTRVINTTEAGKTDHSPRCCKRLLQTAELLVLGQAEVLGTPTREELMAMNPNYTE